MDSRTIRIAVAAVLNAPTDSFTELARLAGLDPRRDFRGADLKGCDFTNCDLSGYDFTGAGFGDNLFDGARVGMAVFDAAVVQSGLLDAAIDAPTNYLPSEETASSIFEALLDNDQDPFMHSEELSTIYGCVRQKKNVNLFGPRGTGKSTILLAAESLIERFGTKVIFIRASGTNQLSLLDPVKESRGSESGESASLHIVPESVFDIADAYTDDAQKPVLLIDDAHLLDESTLLAILRRCLKNELGFVLATTRRIEFLGEGEKSRIVPVAVGPINLEATVEIVRSRFKSGTPSGDETHLIGQAQEMTIGQVLELVEIFELSGSMDLAFSTVVEHAAKDSVERLLQRQVVSHSDLQAITRVMLRTRKRAMTAKEIVARAGNKAFEAVEVLERLYADGLLSKPTRRHYAFRNHAFAKIVEEVLGHVPH